MLPDINNTPLALYVHWPYCLSKCPYCDFNSHVSDSVDVEAFAAAYKKELDFYAEATPRRPLHSIFFGGGTPSLMPPHLVKSIIDHAENLFGLEQGCEITLEANPTSFEVDKFKAFKDGGVNRVSLGVQSLYADDLAFLGRQHSADDAIAAITAAQQIFERFSFDLIYARPEQTPAKWQDELKQALDYGTKHLSLYQLTIEQGTAFYTRHKRGDFRLPDEFLAADMYELTQSLTASYGLPSYETSNHAAMGEESRHNLVYWRYFDYLGIGPGAHGRYTDHEGVKVASRTHLAPEKWLALCANNPHGAHPFEIINAEESFTEAVMMGLRLKEGINLSGLAKRLGVTWDEQINRDKIDMLIREDLLTFDADTQIRATNSGALCINSLLNILLN